MPSTVGGTIPSSHDECREQTGYDSTLTQWQDFNKGDQSSPQIRSMLVALETPYRSSIDPQRLERTLC